MQIRKRAREYFLYFGVVILLPIIRARKKILLAHECTMMDIALEGWYELQ